MEDRGSQKIEERDSKIEDRQETSMLAPLASSLSPLRAWLYLVRLRWQRQARTHQMGWSALILAGLT